MTAGDTAITNACAAYAAYQSIIKKLCCPVCGATQYQMIAASSHAGQHFDIPGVVVRDMFNLANAIEKERLPLPSAAAEAIKRYVLRRLQGREE